MYKNFELKTTAEHIEGYIWDIENPKFVVCLIHGIAEYAGRYDRVADIFNKNDVAVIGMDLRGHGLSSGVRGHCAPRKAVLSDIDSLIEYAQTKYPSTPVVLYGHSMGGNIALDYWRRGKKNTTPAKYIVSSPWLMLSRRISRPLYVFTKAMAVIWPTFQLKSNINPAELGNVKIIADCSRPNLVHNSITVLTGLEGYDFGLKMCQNDIPFASSEMEKIPMLLMHGSEDRVCSVEGSRKLSSHIKNCTYKEWAGYYHEIHNGYGDVDGSDVINRMVDFILSD